MSTVKSNLFASNDRAHRALSTSLRAILASLLLSSGSIPAGCSNADKSDSTDAGDFTSSANPDEPPEPKYASPWDRPLALKYKPKPVKQPVATGQAPSPKSLSELLQAADSDTASAPPANAAITPSDWVLPDKPLKPSETGAATLALKDDAQKRLSVANKSDWTIILAGFDREKEGPLAADALDKVRVEAGLTEAYLEERGKALVVAYGRYPSPSDPQAKQDLERIKAMRVGGAGGGADSGGGGGGGGGTPFSSAVLAPPVYESLPGTIPDYDLRNVKAQYGVDALYTLQIGVYTVGNQAEPTAKNLGEIRSAAEKAVVNLRREGEMAFYYHGPRRSMVTIGVFGPKDYDVQRPQNTSPVLTLLKRKYPHNLENGAGVRRKRPGQAEATIDPSFIVVIPNN